MVRAAALNAAAYGERLLADLGARPERALALVDEPWAVAWARSGAMALTGERSGPAQLCPVPLASCAEAALALVSAMAPQALPADISGGRLLAERAALSGLARAGSESCGGACRLLEAGDGGIALNLARETDWELLGAWLECGALPDWNAVRSAVWIRSCRDLVTRGRELGLAVSAVDADHAAPARWFRVGAEQAANAAAPRARPRVVDLSSLWAGPLCSQLLQLGGAEIIKVESLERPDGARQGPRAFFDLLNAGKRSVALDLQSAPGRARLLTLLHDADIVIEASRPRALRQLGIEAEALVRERPNLTWISLTGHGRGEPQENWIAYGDDAGVDAGLTRVMHEAVRSPMFVGDAIADPLAGLHAAAFACWSWRQGGSRLVSISLSEVVRYAVEFAAPSSAGGWAERHREGLATLRERGQQAEAPTVRIGQGHAAALGADTDAVLDSPARTC